VHRYVGKEGEETYERREFREYKIPVDVRNVGFERTALTSTTRSDRTTRSTEMVQLIRDLEIDIRLKQQKAADLLRSIPVPDSTAVQPDTNSVFGSRLVLLETATTRIREHRSRVQELASSTVWAARRANRFRVEVHKKFSIAFACFVFVLIGIPLGLRVRRGGLGIVSALSLGIFMIYWISLVQGEKLADRGFLDPWVGMWAANILIGFAAIVFFAIVAGDLKHRRVRKSGV